ncbi:MAG TPA: peptidase M16, partial [Lachnospiraceae bacterium]|nr:peptidase M16 [Lachnospiraceae bacterium]
MAKSIKSSKELMGLPAYELEQEEAIKEIGSLGLVYRHKKSGARVVVMSNDDDNKVFSIAFRTPPEDSTGVAHIVEHTVLCGSKKYPSKDPFVELAKGSLNTFLNAMTFSDKTMYPVASCNDKDYQNLMNVYMDAVFYPNIYKKKAIFEQEGWYYELENEEDELKINGVVYNEMKGVFSSPEQQLYRMIQSSLFPDTTYGIESGGDPKNIPDLTYEAYLDFHKKYYHPSNSYIYLYGDMDVEEKLNWMDKEYLSHFGFEPVDSEIKKQSAFKEMKTIRSGYSISESEADSAGAYLSYNVVLDTSLNRDLYLAFQILESALISFPGAPVKQALIDAGIGSDILSQFENGIYQPYFSIIAKEVSLDREKEFLTIIMDTLRKICKEGIGEQSLRAAINYHEFRFKEGDFGSYPKGLMYGIQVLDSWLYDDKSAFIHLQAEETFHKMKEYVTTGYFEKLIEEYLLDNPHSTLVILEPEVGLTAKGEQELKEKLAAYKATLTKEELQTIIRENKELREWQETPSTQEELELIPLLERKDIRRNVRPIQNEKYNIANVTTLHHNVTTNGIGYIRIGFAIDDYIGYGNEISLLSYVLGKVSTEDMDYQQLANKVNILTGGIVYDVEVYGVRYEKDVFRPYLEVTVKVLYENMDKAMDLIVKTLYTSVLQ